MHGLIEGGIGRMEGWNGWSSRDGVDGGVEWKEGCNRKKGRLNERMDCYWPINCCPV